MANQVNRAHLATLAAQAQSAQSDPSAQLANQVNPDHLATLAALAQSAQLDPSDPSDSPARTVILAAQAPPDPQAKLALLDSLMKLPLPPTNHLHQFTNPPHSHRTLR